MYDTLDRGRAEEREEFLRRLIEGSHDCIKVLDLEGRLLFMSPGGMQIMEIKDIAPYLKTSWIDFWKGEDRGAAKNAIEEATGGGVGRFQGRCLTVTGQPHWLDTMITPIRGREGKPEKLLALSRDITDQRLAEEKLKETVARLESVLSGITDAYMALDCGWRFIEVNQVAAKILGRPTKDLIGKVIWDEYPQARGSKPQEQFQLAMTEGRPIHFEARSSLVDAWFEFHAYPHADRLEVYWRDITERKRTEEALLASEERLRIAQDKAKLRVWDWDRKTNLVHFTLPPSRIFGLPATAPITYEDVRRHVHPEDLGRAEAEREEAIARHEPFDVEYRVLLASGETRWIASKGGAVYGSSGEVLRVLGINIDITERKRMEEDLRTAKLSAEDAKQAAEQASRAKDHFMAVLSHELRTPLTPVLTAVSMLQEETGLDQEKRENLEMIRRNVELEARFIDDLLDLTRIARGKVDLDRHPIELCKVLHRAVEVCLPDIEARKLHFGVVIKDAPYFVNADAGRLQQVFWNLLKNSIKFTPPEGSIGIDCRARDPTTVIVEVQDSGIGIEPEMLGRIFNAFEQAEQTIHRRFGGLGLGLTISKALIEMHGGTIEAHSAGKDKGSTFSVRLPRVVAPSPFPQERSADARPSAGPRGLRILLVEDHGDTARVMGRLLASTGNEVKTAGDVAMALDLAGKEAFDLLISDLGLPDGNGYDLLRQLRARGAKMPAIALSGYGQEQDVRQSMTAGFSAHLVKPTDLQKLRETIANVMSWGPR